MSEERCAAHSNSTAFEILDTLSQDLESTKSFFSNLGGETSKIVGLVTPRF